MKKFFLLFACLFVVSISWAADAPHPSNLLPIPAEVTWQEGEFPLNPNFSYAVAGKPEPRVEHAIKRFLERLSKRTGLTFSNTSRASLNQAFAASIWIVSPSVAVMFPSC